MKQKLLKIYLLLFISALTFVHSYAQTQGTRPNIIVILADDLGYGDVGFNRDSSFPIDRGVIPTPNIDALASAGVVLKNAHVSHPFCGPSRVAIMTGMLPHRIGAQYNLPNDITSTLGVPVNETYFPKVLKTSGYKTSAFGKWHLGFKEGAYQPLDRGFDYFFGFLGGGKNYFENVYEDSFYSRLGGSNPVTNEYQDPIWRDRGYVAESEFSDADNEDYLTDLLTNDAIALYNSTYKMSSDPYFMYLSYNAPHTPLQAPAAEEAQFKLDNPNFEDLIRNSPYITESTPVSKLTDPTEKAALIEKFVQARITYATMVTNMDINIGKLVAELKKDMTKFNNTVIIFLSDNGGYTHSKGAVNWPLDAGKGSVKEGGHKVPMFVSWPNKITATSTTYNHQISSLDIYPTVVSLAGGTIPAGKIIDGVNFMDKLIASEDARPDDGLLILRPQNGFHNGGIAYDHWKIVKTANGGQWNLYDISTDPGEVTNVRGSVANGEQIVQTILDKAIALVVDFKDVKPAWYDNDNEDIDNDGSGDGHAHSFLWDDGTLPGYDRLFESPLLKLEGELSKISIVKTKDAIEGNVDGIFTVSLPEGILATEDINVTYTVSGVATQGTDYTTLSGTTTISNGTNAAQIIITAAADGLDEVSETVIITLGSTTFGNVNVTPAEINIFDVIEPTRLTAGDVVIVGFKAESGNKGAVTFMLLKDISATTKISFSNRSWTGTQNGWTGAFGIDDVWTWTAGAAFSTGTMLKLDTDGKVKRVVGNAEIEEGTTVQNYGGADGVTLDGDFDVSPAGDTVLMYQVNGTFAEPTTGTDAVDNSYTWITGLNTNATGWAIGGGNSFSAIPTAIDGFTIDATNGVNADRNYGVYRERILGTPAELRKSINDSANWETSETESYALWSYTETVGTVVGNIGVAGTLAVNKYEMDKTIGVYPNPVKNFIQIKISKGTLEKAELFNVTGTLIQSFNTSTLNMTQIPTGVYFLSIKTSLGTSNKKIIKL